MSKIFKSMGQDNAVDEKDALRKIFATIDTDGTGSCSIEELNVGSNIMIIKGESFILGVEQRRK